MTFAISSQRRSELPVQAPVKFQLVINLKTATLLHLTVPTSLIVAAEEVIEPGGDVQGGHMRNDRRLIEDYLPIEAISAEASGEPRTKGHISTLHLWRARRPLVACRAAVYGALVPESQFESNGGRENKTGAARASAKQFVEALCRYPGAPTLFREAEQHILKAHAARLTVEEDRAVTVEDIVKGRAPRPRVLDMFAGGGAIPLEAARLGCDTSALELNPVAHLIELCTATFPQTYGSSLADDVEKWGQIVLRRTASAVADLSTRICDRVAI